MNSSFHAVSVIGRPSALYGLICGVVLLGGCASVLGIEAVALDEGAGGASGGAGMGGAGMGGAGMGGAGMGGAGMGGAGMGGAGGASCIPKKCAELGKNCGDVNDGCNGTVSCGDCPFGKVCGFGGVANVCGGTLQVRNGYVLSDGTLAYSQNCSILPDGSVDCAAADYPFTSFSLVPSMVTLDAGTHISDRFGSAYSRGSEQFLLNGYLQSDGAKEWTQICGLPEGGVAQCDPATHPYQMTTLPPPGMTLDAGTHVGGRYTYVYVANGVLLLRSGYVQSDGLKVHSQDCAIDAAGVLDCDPMAHKFNTFALSAVNYPLDPGTTFSDRFMYVHGVPGALKLHLGNVQSDGKQEFFQECDLPATGILDCAFATHPVVTVGLPPAGIPVGGIVIHHRYAFDYVK